ncbi:MAG: preprotein translocase subunit SecG [Acholeplasmataceae bacterium]|jgi:preprotein translocase subunit SecG|nr:preprotein translocase subunit SecG [Acholeplasmataceae bacterium]
MQWIDYIVLIASVILIAIVLMSNAQDDIQDAFSGARSELFKNQKARGFERVLNISALVISVIFVVATIVSRVLIG